MPSPVMHTYYFRRHFNFIGNRADASLAFSAYVDDGLVMYLNGSEIYRLRMPGGAIMQYIVADFRTPKGVLLEGRGVQPDRRVVETRAALAGGRDPVLDAGVVAARASATP